MFIPVILDLPKNLAWANIRAWAPAIAEKNGKFYFYYSANQNIGVAIAEKPAGPFTDPLGKPLVAKGTGKGQVIDHLRSGMAIREISRWQTLGNL